jgi:hypothetical protein
MTRMRFTIVVICLVTCSSFGQVTRHQAITMADADRTLTWIPSARNAFHGTDRAGVRIDTPDAAFRPANTRPGWWIPNRRNTGVPYMWGGFSSLEEFPAGIRAGKLAGDIYTSQKRQMASAAVSK